MAQSGGDLVLDPASKVPVRRILHLGKTAQRAHRQLHRRLQRQRQALRLEQIRSSPKASQSPFRGSVIPDTSRVQERHGKAQMNDCVSIAASYRAQAEGEGEITMRSLVILAAVCFSTSAYAQHTPPKVGNTPLAQIKP